MSRAALVALGAVFTVVPAAALVAVPHDASAQSDEAAETPLQAGGADAGAPHAGSGAHRDAGTRHDARRRPPQPDVVQQPLPDHGGPVPLYGLPGDQTY
jgi:hypothetical protein